MRVCTIVPSYYPAIVYGGPIISIHSVNRELAGAGIKVYVSTSNADGDKKIKVEANRYIKFEENYFVKYYNDNIIGRLSLSFIFSVWKDIKQSDLVRIEDIFSTYIPPSLIYAKIFKKPIIISPRGVLSTWSLNNKRRMLKRMWALILIKPFINGSWWHATCEAEAVEIKGFYPKAKVRIIPNGIDLTDYDDIELHARGDYLKKFAKVHLEQKNVITSMGRIHAKKGFDILIDAFNSLYLKGFDGVLLIAGKDDGYKLFLEERVGELNLGDRIFFVGELDGKDKLEFLSGSDLFVLPSHSENFGNVYLEALACGVPIVASKNTPWSEVEKAGCGKWVDNSIDATSIAIQEMFDKLSNNENKIKSIKETKKYASNFSWKAVSKMFDDLFFEILKK
jgi:glycosyltransferase involved in cell wall biosynthesis